MPITLNAPLAWKKADPDETKLLQALQGNILKGHGRHFAAHIFFKLDAAKPVESRRLLRDLANYRLTSAHQQLLATERFHAGGESGGPFVHLALSFKGYQALGAAAAAPADPDFQGGMKAPASLAALADPPVASWEPPFQQDLHGVVLAAAESPAATAALAGQIEELLHDAGATFVFVQRGAGLFNAAGNGIENFGYVDGRSQPLLLQEDIEAENAAAGSSRWDPAFPLDAALLKDPGAGVGDTFSHGSFFVFRKLEQDVRGFKLREQQVADVLGLTGDARELAGALLVGRFEDGTPVTLSDEGRGVAPQNDFNYQGDPGKRCPFHAHIRKSNPRGSGGGEPELLERRHLMPRRGMPYEDIKRTVHPDELPESSTLAEFNAKVAPLLPTGGVGLLFMAYNNRIAQQFKFTQQSWVNATTFPAQPPGAHGIDPVIGQGPNNPGDQKLLKEWDNAASPVVANAGMAGFVKMRGGEYFFSPSLTFLRNL
jgi:Dyp-type peroxidase family